VRVTTPRLWFARNAREFNELTSGTPPAPSATREFRRTDRLLIRFDALAPGTVPPTVTAQLLNQQGKKMADVTVAAADGAPFSIDLPLANLAPAQYLLEITADAEGHKPVSELVAFRVGS
jgi:hypothetical protein